MGLLLAAAVVVILSIAATLLSNFNWRSYHKGQLAGPKWVWPVVGATLYCITDPYGYWITQRNYGKLSWNSLFGQFLIVAGDVASCRSVLTQTGYVYLSTCSRPLPNYRKSCCAPHRRKGILVIPVLPRSSPSPSNASESSVYSSAIRIG